MNQSLQTVRASDFFLPSGLTQRDKTAAASLLEKFKENRAAFSSAGDIISVRTIIKKRARVEQALPVKARIDRVTFYQHVQSANALVNHLGTTADAGQATKIQNIAASVNEHILAARKFGAKVRLKEATVEKLLPTEAAVRNATFSAHIHTVVSHVNAFDLNPGAEPRVAQIVKREIEGHLDLTQKAAQELDLTNPLQSPRIAQMQAQSFDHLRERLTRIVARVSGPTATPA